MARLYALLAGVLAIFGAIGTVFLKGGQAARRKAKIKSLDAKITALKKKDEVDEISDDDVIATLHDKWVRPDDKQL